MPNGEFQYTKAGNKYFQANDHFEYVLGMPVKITTHTGRQQGRVRHDSFPVSKLGVTGLLQSQLGTEAEREQRVKTLVLLELGVTAHNKVILEISGETYEYDEEGEWDVNRMGR